MFGDFQSCWEKNPKNSISGNSERLQNFAVANLLPDTSGYMTYDGSQTEPGCGEALTWVIMNRPIYITHQQVS